MTLWSPIESATLLKLYPDADEWFYFFYLLSDRLEEDGDRVGAECVRWLSGWGQRPFQQKGREPKEWWKVAFWWTDSDPWQVWTWRRDAEVFKNRNYLPLPFGPVCRGWGNQNGAHPDTHYPDPVSALTACVGLYKTFTPEVRQDLNDNWKVK